MDIWSSPPILLIYLGKWNDMMHSIGRVSLIGLFEKGDYTFSGLVYVEDLMMFTVHWLFSVYYFIDVKDNWTNDWQHDIGTRVLENLM